MKRYKKYRKLPVYGYSPKGRKRTRRIREYSPLSLINMALNTSTTGGSDWYHRNDVYRYSVRTPNWRVLLEAGQQLPNNPYICYRSTETDIPSVLVPLQWQPIPGSLPVRYLAVDTGQRWKYTMHYLFGAPVGWEGSTQLVNDLYNTVQNKVLQKLKARKLNLGQFIGEWHQTASLLVSSASKIANAAHELRRFNVMGAIRALDSGVDHETYRRLKRNATVAKRKGVGGARFLADNWLSYQFGWKPLLADVNSACELLYDGLRNQTDEYTVRAKSSKLYKRASSSKGSGFVLRFHANVLCEARCTITFRIRNQGIEVSTSLGLLNPLSLAWELLPYSFVVDWFFDVGNFLENLDSTSGLDFARGTVSLLEKGGMQYAAEGIGPSGDPSSNPNPISGGLVRKRKIHRKQRIVLTNFPSLSLKLVSKEEDKFGINSSVKVLDTAALVFQRLGDLFNHRR